MKKLMIGAVLAGMLAAPALARPYQRTDMYRAPYAMQNEAYDSRAQAPSPNVPESVYGVGGQFLGNDPDPNVRFELRRDENWRY